MRQHVVATIVWLNRPVKCIACTHSTAVEAAMACWTTSNTNSPETPESSTAPLFCVASRDVRSQSCSTHRATLPRTFPAFSLFVTADCRSPVARLPRSPSSPPTAAMVKFSKTLHVAASRSRCFELLRDWSRASSWDPAIIESTKVPGQPTDAFGVGTKWNIQFQPSPDSKPMSVDYTTTKYDAGESGTKSTLGFTGNATFVRSIDTLEMTDAPGADGAPGTDVSYTADVRLRYLLAPFSFTLQGKMDDMAEPAMEGLQKFCDKNLV